MRYQGGKSRLAKKLAPFIRDALRKTSGQLIEPFCGGFNIVPAVQDDVRLAICNDHVPSLISLMSAVMKGWQPPHYLSLEEYRSLRYEGEVNDPMTGFAAFGCSFGGREWGGYARGGGRNYAAEAAAALVRKRPAMERVMFQSVDYIDIPQFRGSTYYCDPPYRGTAGYLYQKPFNSAEFYAWAESIAISGLGNIVLVSEFTAPAHWQVLWEEERPMALRRNDRSKAIERLYLVRPSWASATSGAGS